MILCLPLDVVNKTGIYYFIVLSSLLLVYAFLLNALVFFYQTIAAAAKLLSLEYCIYFALHW